MQSAHKLPLPPVFVLDKLKWAALTTDLPLDVRRVPVQQAHVKDSVADGFAARCEVRLCHAVTLLLSMGCAPRAGFALSVRYAQPHKEGLLALSKRSLERI